MSEKYPCRLGENEPSSMALCITLAWRRAGGGSNPVDDGMSDAEVEKKQKEKRERAEKRARISAEAKKAKAEARAALKRKTIMEREAEEALRIELSAKRREERKAETARKRKAYKHLKYLQRKAEGKIPDMAHRKAAAGRGAALVTDEEGRVTPGTAATRLRVPKTRVWYYVNNNLIPSKKIDGNTLIFPSDFEAEWIARHPALVTEDRDGDLQVDPESWKV